MQERATAIGGTWHIDTGKGTGTRVSVRLPRRNIP
jgi:signal transduction histidine kinase